MLDKGLLLPDKSGFAMKIYVIGGFGWSVLLIGIYW